VVIWSLVDGVRAVRVKGVVSLSWRQQVVSGEIYPILRTGRPQFVGKWSIGQDRVASVVEEPNAQSRTRTHLLT